MFIIPTKKIKSEATSSAGTSRAGNSRAELQSVGERRNYRDRELTAKDVREMDSTEYAWFMEFFPNRVEEAANREATKKANKENEEAWKIKRMWEEGGEEIEAALPMVSRFVADHPQFDGSNEANRKAIVNWLVQMNVRCTYDNLVRAFQDLAADGKLTLRDGDTELSGETLRNSPRLRVLLEPQSQPLPADQSADAFYASHPELHPGTPFLIRQREQQKEDTKKFFEQAANATARGSVVNVTDYPSAQNGVAPLPDKASFRIKVRSMSAAEILQRCNDDPAFKKALDELK